MHDPADVNWPEATVLVTGGTGSFGRKFVEQVFRSRAPRKLIVFSRDEYKQFEMQQSLRSDDRQRVRYFIGDIRDRERLYRALEGVDVLVHAAALKQVPAMEYNPIEAVKTNVMGAANIVDAAIDRNVRRVIALSTDKAVNPVNLYGATKLCMEKLLIQANNYSGAHNTRFSVVRYGNVIGSRGSVVPFFRQQKASGVLPITDDRMTRFWITLDQSVEFVLRCIERMAGGEIFVPKMASSLIKDLATAIGPECRQQAVGIRPGEKLHEVLVSMAEALSTVECDDHFVIFSKHDASSMQAEEQAAHYREQYGGISREYGFQYTSEDNLNRLSVEALREWLEC